MNLVTINNVRGYIDENGVVLNKKRISKYDILALAARSEDEQEAWKLLNIASMLFHKHDDKTFNTLYGCVAFDIARHFSESEYDIYPLFKKNISQTLPGAKIITGKTHRNHRPDAWINYQDKDVPVEMKVNNFDNKALAQLMRYVDYYKSEIGLAIGSKLTTDLPSNIIFISIDQLKEVRTCTN